MPRIRDFINDLTIYDRAEITLGLSYVVDDGVKTFVVPAEGLRYWMQHSWFGRNDVEFHHELHQELPRDFRGLLESSYTAKELSDLLLSAFESFDAHQDDPWYLLGREFSHQ